MHFPRSSGILLHITSLPGPHGIGDLGEQAYQFVDFLQAAGQRVWQILPLSPPAFGDSPYSSFSAFAGNPLLINLAQLAEDGLLDVEQVATVEPIDAPGKADYAAAQRLKRPLLDEAYRRFSDTTRSETHEQYDAYCLDNAWWLVDYARFEAYRERFGTSDWTRWPEQLVHRVPEALMRTDRELAEAIARAKFFQFLFHLQWSRLKQYANERQVRMYGDMPIFVAHESADVWAHQGLFSLDEGGRPTVVAGVPPDYFSETGQRWGNPLYRWDALRGTDYAWWTQRFRSALEFYDLLRVDHFRGFEAYWEIPADAPTAVDGRWCLGPGTEPFDAAREQLGPLPIIAEDLGLITDEVHQLREDLGFPGMRVLQFGFDNPEDDFHRPDQYPANSVAYTGTHDNDTIMGWYGKRRPKPKSQTLADEDDPLAPYLRGDEPVHWQLCAAVLESRSDTAILPMQDVLGLGNAARMNLPGQATGNWTWRVAAEACSPELATRLQQATERSGR
ncbi:4-alpha-glucanotransferase [Roseimaritima sediminicola]|uniref:4-alpha-glucanotransferase n=1 Tax=Roseimaritima sediminicola TaxID=2662066 RepID=UPI0012984030|nr:4-alpha-glucanotransferase [Roseimaritima sediminicola]